MVKSKTKSRNAFPFLSAGQEPEVENEAGSDQEEEDRGGTSSPAPAGIRPPEIEKQTEYSKDLRSYLKYCGDVIFAGLTPSYEESKLIERLWSFYDNKEDDDEQAESEHRGLNVKRQRDAEISCPSMDSKSVKKEKQVIRTTEVSLKPSSSTTARKAASSSTTARKAALESMKFDMEDDGFEYLPPRVLKKSNGYLHYSRQSADGKYIFVAHADYYIMLRACARLAEVDPRILHIGVLKFEKRLDWIEKRIDQSLRTLKSCSLQDGVPHKA